MYDNPSTESPLTILYHDNHLVAVHKPAGMLVHRSPISQDRHFVLQTLRNQIGRRVYPVHRLDRATSGVLLFALDSDTARALVNQFEQRSVDKSYLAVTRGWTADQGRIDHPVADEEGNGIAQPATTSFHRLARLELPFAVDRYPTSRYSLVDVHPETGRRQQIRRHFKHISHHLIGDTTHGNGRHNRFFRQQFGIHRLLLQSQRIGFRHPADDRQVTICAVRDGVWQQIEELFGQRLF
ncbi:MAG: pseudouridylate synthase [Gammaproteobacteria bacterium]|nr:pseudouridylate synthase [Gammaproteobacteria bacterium]